VDTRYKVLMSVVIIALLCIPLSCVQPQENLEPHEVIRNWTVENETHFLRLCEENNLTSYFTKKSYLNYTSYSPSPRTIEGVPVDGDGFGFMFKDGELFDSHSHWRTDLPDVLPTVISKEEAIRIVGGDANTTVELRYIEPLDRTWYISPTSNPCWIVRTWFWDEAFNEKTNETVGFLFNNNVTVIDAVLGTVIGYGVPYP